MKMKPSSVRWLGCCLLLFVSMSGSWAVGQYPRNEQTSSPVTFCYYSSHAYNRPGLGKFEPEDVDSTLCTHVIFAFADVVAGSHLEPSSLDHLGESGLFKRMTGLKNRNPSLKVLLAVGGWAAGSEPFLPVVKSEQSRRRFAVNTARFLRHHGFDGLDVDWEFPGARGGSENDKVDFTALLKELQLVFANEAVRSGKDKLLLTMAAAGGSYFINLAYEPVEVVKYVDYLLVMTYNYHGSWNSFTGHHSALFPRRDEQGGEREWNQAWSIDFWLNQAGTPKNKLVVGIPTYGMSFTLDDPRDTGLNAKATGGGSKGPFTGESGILAYYEICKNLESGWMERWVDEQKVPFAYKDRDWVGYENERSARLKAKYINYLGLAGAFIWSVEMDDFRGVCGRGRYPLLTAITDTLKERKQTSSLRNNFNDPSRRADIDINAEQPYNRIMVNNEVVIVPSRELATIGQRSQFANDARYIQQTSQQNSYNNDFINENLNSRLPVGSYAHRIPVVPAQQRSSSDTDVVFGAAGTNSNRNSFKRVRNTADSNYSYLYNRGESRRNGIEDYEKSAPTEQTIPEDPYFNFYNDIYQDAHYFSDIPNSDKLVTQSKEKEYTHATDFPCVQNGMFPDPNSCTNYFVCVQNRGQWYNFRMKCPDDLAYIAETASCEYRPSCS